MTTDEYEQWREAALVSSAKEMVDSGMLTPEAAQARSAGQHAEFLPQEQATPGMHLLRVLDHPKSRYRSSKCAAHRLAP